MRFAALVPVLLLAATLAHAQPVPPPVPPVTPVTSKDLTKLATDFATSMGLIGPVVCRTDTADGYWTVCQSPVNPGITCGPTSFVCDAKGCLIPPGYIPVPPGSPVPSTPAK